MNKKDEIQKLIDAYDVAYFDYIRLKKLQIIAILLFFIGGFIIFLIINNKKTKLTRQKAQINRELDAVAHEIPIDDYLELKKKILMVANQ